MFNNLDMLIIASYGGCGVLVHHFENVEGVIPMYSANHLLVFLCNKHNFQAIISISFFILLQR